MTVVISSRFHAKSVQLERPQDSINMDSASSAEDDALRSEGRILLTYVLRQSPHSALIERYCSAIRARHSGLAIHLPATMRRFPFLMLFYEPVGKGRTSTQERLVQRLQMATSLAETDPTSSAVFCALECRSQYAVWFEWFGIMAVECAAFPVRALITVFAK